MQYKYLNHESDCANALIQKYCLLKISQIRLKMWYHIHRSRGTWIVAPESDTWRKEKCFIWTFTLQIPIQLVCRISKQISSLAFSSTIPKQNSMHGQNNLNATYHFQGLFENWIHLWKRFLSNVELLKIVWFLEHAFWAPFQRN